MLLSLLRHFLLRSSPGNYSQSERLAVAAIKEGKKVKEVALPTGQGRACSLCRVDVHSSSAVGSSARVHIANTGTLHSYNHLVWQLGNPLVLTPSFDVIHVRC